MSQMFRRLTKKKKDEPSPVKVTCPKWSLAIVVIKYLLPHIQESHLPEDAEVTKAFLCIQLLCCYGDLHAISLSFITLHVPFSGTV